MVNFCNALHAHQFLPFAGLLGDATEDIVERLDKNNGKQGFS